jgi:tRNA(fMet)-specific endonuclease VapC
MNFNVYLGMAINPPAVARIRPIIEDFLASVTFIAFNEKEAQEAATIRSFLKVQGTPIGYYDLLIAATAKSNGSTLVTANTQEFERVAHLLLENWRIA